MIKIKDLSKAYNGKPVFDGLDMEFEDGGRYALRGPSGCGKTTLLHIISGLDKDYKGTVEYDGVISYVFQESRLLPNLSAYDNVFLVCKDKEKTEKLLECVGLTDDRDKYPSELSGGMKTRISIARALAYTHDILLLDEPFTGLDGDIKDRIIELIKRLEDGKTIIMVTHDDKEAEALGCTEINM